MRGRGMSYRIGEWRKAANDFRAAFGASIQPFYDGFATVLAKSIQIDPFEFDDYLHKVHGEYELQNKSMDDIVLENYGEKALEVLNQLVGGVYEPDGTGDK
jgi:hypothetical protein